MIYFTCTRANGAVLLVPSPAKDETCYDRFVRWQEAGVWDRLMDAITEACDGDIQMIDSTSISVHQQAATAKCGGKIIVSVAPGAASHPRSTRSSTAKAFPFGSA